MSLSLHNLSIKMNLSPIYLPPDVSFLKVWFYWHLKGFVIFMNVSHEHNVGGFLFPLKVVLCDDSSLQMVYENGHFMFRTLHQMLFNVFKLLSSETTFGHKKYKKGQLKAINWLMKPKINIPMQPISRPTFPCKCYRPLLWCQWTTWPTALGLDWSKAWTLVSSCSCSFFVIT